MNRLFTPLRFGILLALLIFAMFPHVILGVETFVARDFGFFAYPLAHFQRDCFWRGELPFWDPYNNCGVPFLAQWNTMPLYPPSLIYLTLPLEWSLSFFCLVHLWWTGLGMFFLARRWTSLRGDATAAPAGNNFAATFAGVIFAFNGFTLNLLMWPSHIATFSWMPWVVLAAEPAWRGGGRKIFLAAIVGALQMLAGGPETIFLTWLIVAASWLQQFIAGGRAAAPPPRNVMLRRFLFVIVLVTALSAVQLLPFLDLVAHAQREAGFADLRWSMPGRGWANFLVPMAFGSTHTEGIFFQHGQYWTSSYYLGLGALWLALLAVLCLRDHRARLLGAIALAGLVLALGGNTPVLPALRTIIPQLSFITYPIKYISVLIFAVPLLAALALANLEKTKRVLVPSGVFLFLVLAGILFWIQNSSLPGDDSRLALVNGYSRVAFLILTGPLIFALARKDRSGIFGFAPAALVLVAWLDVFTHEPAQNPTVRPNVFELNLAREELKMTPQPELGGSRVMLSPAAAYEFVSFAASDPRNNFLAKRAGYCANANLLDAVPKVDGFFSLMPREGDDVLSYFYRTTNADYPRLEDFMGVSQITAPGELFQWRTRTNHLPLVTAGQKPVFIDDSQMEAHLKDPAFDGGKMVFLPQQSSSFVTVSNQTAAKILNPKFRNQTVDFQVEAAEPSLVVIAQTYYHNWRGTVDDQPISLLCANVGFQAVQVPKGTHKIHLAYVDRAFQIGAAISGLAWLGCISALLVLRRK